MQLDDPDRTLFEAWRNGDSQAGDKLFIRHFDGIYGFLRRMAGDSAAEDLVQTTWMQCLRSVDKFNGRGTFRAYLYGIAHNVFYEHLRRRHRRDRLDDLLERSQEELGMSPLVMLAERQEVILVAHALRRIPIADQVLFQLYYWEKLPASALAEMMKSPVGTVRSRLRKAKERIQAKIAELASSPEELSSTLSGFDTWAERVRACTPWPRSASD